jgi:hypothetical protein
MTRLGCSACAAAETEIERVCAELGVPWSATDVDTDPRLRAEYGDRVPVTLVDGREHSVWGVDADELRAALS